MIRVAHVITGLGTGGSETMLTNLLERTDRSRFDPAVIALSDFSGPIAGRIDSLGVPRMHLGMRPLPSPLAALRLGRTVRLLAPDLVQGWMYHGNLAALAAAKLLPRRVPVLWKISAANANLREEKLTTAAAILLGGMLSGAPDRIINSSTASVGLHERDLGFRWGRWEIIPNGFDTARFAPSAEARRDIRTELHAEDQQILIGLIGRYHPVKDHSNFLRAAARLNSPAVLFVLAGKGVDSRNQELIDEVRSLRMERSVRLLGERTDIPRLAAALDIATCASWSENFPMAIGEAMSAGVPAVVTDVGEAARLVSGTGRIVPARNPDALAAAWRELIAMGPEQCQALGIAARQRIELHFSLDSVVRLHEALYESLVRGPEKGKERRCAA